MGLFSYGERVQEEAMSLQQTLMEAVSSGNIQELSEHALKMLRYMYIGIAYDKYGFMAAIDLQTLFDDMSDKEKEDFKVGLMQSLMQLA